MESSTVLQQQIDALAIEARSIMDVPERESREPNEAENARFDQITDQLIPDLKEKKASAIKREEKMIELTNQNKRINKMQELAEIINAPATQPRQITSNGQADKDEDRVYVRCAKLKCFKTEREAFDAGMFYRAITAKLYNREDLPAIQHCHKRGFDISNAAYEGSGSSGGYLVPAPLAATIIEVREEVGIARRVARIEPMTSDTLTIPKKVGGLTVYYPAELGTITDSDKSWGQVALVAEKRAVASKISQELVDDALISIVDNVVSEQAYALALQEDNEMLNGTGASTYGHVLGLLPAIGAGGVSTAAVSTTWAALTLGEVMTAMSLLPGRFQRAGLAWICSHNFFWATFARLAASAGGNNIADIQGGPTGFRFLGVPVFLTPQMPIVTAVSTKSALFGDFSQAVILGDRMGVRIGRDDSVGFMSDYTTLKATSRYDIQIHEQGTASLPGAYVALATHA